MIWWWHEVNYLLFYAIKGNYVYDYGFYVADQSWIEFAALCMVYAFDLNNLDILYSLDLIVPSRLSEAIDSISFFFSRIVEHMFPTVMFWWKSIWMGRKNIFLFNVCQFWIGCSQRDEGRGSWISYFFLSCFYFCGILHIFFGRTVLVSKIVFRIVLCRNLLNLLEF